ncbi:hypothetical protein C1752_12058 [Acaryochloris thomasi RCC1774]|uniref:Sulfotransferase domain-containing protein n=1 Tax=Acaryochloris thomasi RCC1774 TaxID=1764569 RepID=A0A2W1JNK7_9CYAN|nr:sulfotransferase domain-containing protein [Acaryochloris thomasi]PZD70487.1 hypothetical protein C1752_12058 [Acaryochloris thomasi RCC1774]
MNKLLVIALRIFRYVTYGPTDIYVVSYPKSGRTWLQSLIRKYLSLKYDLPEIEILSPKLLTKGIGLPRIKFTHDETHFSALLKYDKLSTSKRKFHGKKVLLIKRNIKDTLVSSYFHTTKRSKDFEGTISEFIRSDEFGVLKILKFYDIWLQNQDRPRTYISIQYEDLHTAPKDTLMKVLSFLGELNISEEYVDRSIEYCSFKNLNKLESKNKLKTAVLGQANTKDPDSFLIRKGKVGGHLDYLSQEDIEFIDKTIDQGMEAQQY